jgi:hypothetical protein
MGRQFQQVHRHHQTMSLTDDDSTTRVSSFLDWMETERDLELRTMADIVV